MAATPSGRYRAAYNQAVNPETWMLGEPMDAATRAAIELGIAGATPPHYQGPDGRHYFHNARTLEDAATRAHRAGHVAGKTMDEIAAEAAGPQGMPGTDAYVAWRLGKATPPGAANDNAAPPVAAKPVAEKSQAANPAVTNPATSQPAPAGPPAANDNRQATPRPIGRHASAGPVSSGSGPRIVNGRVAGMAEAATRPGITLEEFAQAADDHVRLGALGLTGGYADDVSAGLNAFFDMLGGANLAEAFAANQAAERQRTAAARERRGTMGVIVEAAPTFLPGGGDAAGLLADFRDYLENGDQWTADDWALVAAGLTPGMPNRRTVKSGKKIVDDVLDNRSTRQSLLAQIDQSKANVLTVSEANRLGGEHKGLIHIAEALPKNKRAREHQSGTDGAFSDVRTKKFASAALRFVNPNKRGRNFIKFEVSGVSDDGNFIELADAKTKLAIWSRGPQQTTLRTLERTKEALIQNPGYRVVYEFNDVISEQKARRFIQKHNYHHYVRTRMRKR
ncbi:hypothetical protein A8950_2314 [Dongia mobilis]|uniref:Uncharacterized protein n=1 Tax=Dongia mobilis TaxID=578943 RepID=A0A4R6WSM4_9PROT|nr:hypothetical protein [Dongia mobilis]TDQ82491.1 hypothetical protein A8950_2314 [Dongia mobilis]